MASPTAIYSSRLGRASRVAELAEEARRLAAVKDHYVSHLSSNLDSIADGFEQRPSGISFARAPHERMSSPTHSEPQGRQGVVFARVGGAGLDYGRPDHRAAVDGVVQAAIDAGGTSEEAIPALRNAGVAWVNNWNSIGAADELHALDPQAISVRKVLPLTAGNHYRFPAPGTDSGIVVNGDWRRAAGRGAGEPEGRLQPPPPPAPPPPVRGYNAGSDPHQKRFAELTQRIEASEPAPDGHVRLYRVGEIATNYKPPETVRMWGREIPYAEWRHSRDEAMKGSFDTNPAGAAGRWATDAPGELDFYVGDNDLNAPVYRFDVPEAELPQYNVRNTPFAGSSRNHDREFVLPDQHLRKAVRIMAVPALIGAGASSQQPGLLDGLREQP